VARIETGRQKGALRLRRLQAGDRISYRGIHRKVSDLLVNAKVPLWDRVNALAVADSEKVLAVLSPAGVFETDPTGEEPLYARLSAAQPPSAPSGGSGLVLPS
jgi:tRNA(Ile)-lysidine synthetase-like protein